MTLFCRSFAYLATAKITQKDTEISRICTCPERPFPTIYTYRLFLIIRRDEHIYSYYYLISLSLKTRLNAH